jgi:hypothetical protein
MGYCFGDHRTEGVLRRLVLAPRKEFCLLCLTDDFVLTNKLADFLRRPIPFEGIVALNRFADAR